MLDENINESIDMLKREFYRIQKLGWVPSMRKGTGGIGYTFETLIGKVEDSFEWPDYYGIEIKTKHNHSQSFCGLFCATPDGDGLFEIKRLQENYGYLDSKCRKYKVINKNVYTKFRTFIGYKFQAMLKIEEEKEKIYLCIFDRIGDLIEKQISWSFDMLREKLYRKLSILAFIKADSKFENGIEYLKYTDITFYTLKGFNEFLELIKNGDIRIKFKIGVFYEGKRAGQIHDRGTTFEIEEKNLLKLYNLYEDN